jgi:hypothetical protein
MSKYKIGDVVWVDGKFSNWEYKLIGPVVIMGDEVDIMSGLYRSDADYIVNRVNYHFELLGSIVRSTIREEWIKYRVKNA